MKLTIFQSGKGNCLLIEAASGELVLCDGGTGASMKKYVRAELSALRDAGRELELAYMSHIDNDHISGVLQMLKDEAAWRAFDRRREIGAPIRKPKAPRPPLIKGILHNGFHDLILVQHDVRRAGREYEKAGPLPRSGKEGRDASGAVERALASSF